MKIRRSLLAGFGMAGGALSFPGLRAASKAAGRTGPTILSTWDFGAAANYAAVARLRAGGSLLEPVEAGAMVPEADPNNHRVGHAG